MHSNGIVNGDSRYESDKVNLKHEEPTLQSKDDGNQKRNSDIDLSESEDSGLSHRKISSYSAADRYKSSQRSHSDVRYNDGDHVESRSHLGERDRSHSRSILVEDEDTRSKSRHRRGSDSSYYDGKDNNYYELDDTRRALHRKDWRHDSKDALRDERREEEETMKRKKKRGEWR